MSDTHLPVSPLWRERSLIRANPSGRSGLNSYSTGHLLTRNGLNMDVARNCGERA
jgi:hypothetical protein